jgi:hypothetical protein
VAFAVSDRYPPRGARALETAATAASSVQESPSGRRKVARDPQRPRITNGKDILPDLDGRSAMARRFKDITSAVLTDQGGADHCSESRLQLVRQT